MRSAVRAVGVTATSTGAPHISTEPQRKEQFPPISTEETFKDVRDRWLDHLEREYMRAMVARFTRDTSAIANASGLDRSYVYRMLRKHEL